MNNPFKTVQEKLKNAVAKLRPAPETKAKILSRSGYTLLAGAGIGLVALVMGPATIAVAAGATTLGLMGLGFGLLQEGDNVKYQIAMKDAPRVEIPAARKAEAAPAPAPAVEAPAAEKKAEAPVAPVADIAPAVVEKKADAAAAAQPAAGFTAVAKKAEEPAPVVAAPAAAPETSPETKSEAPKP